MRRIAKTFGALFIIFHVVGCQPWTEEEADTEDTLAGPVVEQSSLFVEQEDGSYLFTTNDPAYWGPNGYTVWALPCLPQVTFTQRDVLLAKQSGNTYAGFGLVFCQYDTGDPALGETMLVVMINTQQQYSVGEATGSQYTAYTNPTWIQDPILGKGYGLSNEVRVTRDFSGLFTLVLNEKQIMTFRDGRIPLHPGGGEGYIAVISPLDGFPLTQVSICYRDQ